MTDSIIYRPFMELLRAGLWSCKPDLTLFPLSEGQWTEIRKVGLRQTVSAIVYDGMLCLPEAYLPPLEILMIWTAEVEFIERRNKSMDRAVAQLHQLFTKEQISLVLLKGQGLASFYNRPEHRVCGDIDWYIPIADDRKMAEKLLTNQKIKVMKQAGFSQLYVYNGVQVEHHSRLLDCHNPFVRRYIRDLEDREAANSMRISLCGEEVTLPSVLLSYLQVNLHILKHMLSFGIGLRQLCDAARLYYVLNDQVDGEELKFIYSKLGIYRWIQVLNTLLVSEFGLTPEYLPFQQEPHSRYEWMMQEIWTCGNFGFYDTRYGGHNSISGKRRHAWLHLFRRFRLHLYFAPKETLWFPISQLVSHI